MVQQSDLYQGVIFYVWVLKDLLPVSRMVTAIRRATGNKVPAHVSIKFLQGKNRYDRGLPDDAQLTDVIAELRANDISVGGWAFLHTSTDTLMDVQAERAVEYIDRYNLSNWLLDVEDAGYYAMWSSYAGRYNDARNYVRRFTQLTDLPYGYSSYRYPNVWPTVPHKEFLESDQAYVAQQMYWQGAHNPAYQLQQSVNQYRQPNWGGADIAFVPFGSSYCEHGWCPTENDIVQFTDTAQGQFDVCGFWSLDYLIGYNKTEWLDAIAEGIPGETQPPPDPPAPPPQEGTMQEWRQGIDDFLRDTLNYNGPPLPEEDDGGGDEEPMIGVVNASNGLRIRQLPTTTSPTIGLLAYNQTVEVYPPFVNADGYRWGNVKQPVDGYIATDFVTF